MVAADGGRRAVAQPFIHAILPLQSRRDKELNVRWGLDDFAARFGRPAEGMWLPETAVDEETLDVLAEAGVRFTILAPHQASRVRDAGSEDWQDATPTRLPPTRPYVWRGKLSIFFYHELLSKGVVSGESLEPGPDALARKTMARFLPDDSTQLVTVASDGEFYGHHHKKGAAALATSLDVLDGAGVRLPALGEFLDLYPAPQAVDIKPDTSWSCDHGIGRWREDCGCKSPHLPDWKQDWRGPLREALDALSRELESVYEKNAGRFFRDYKEALLAYGEFAGGARDRSDFLKEHGLAGLTSEEASLALGCVELQKHRMASFTSCGWFFDDVSGLEAVQCLQHATRAIDLAKRFNADLEPAFEKALKGVRSNVAKLKDGAGVWKKLVKTARVDLPRAAAHFALCAHVDGDWPDDYGFEVERLGGGRQDKEGLAGRDRALSFCQLKLRRKSDLEAGEYTVFVHQRDRLDFQVWVKGPEAAASFVMLARDFGKLADEDFPAAADKRLGLPTHTLEAMFREERLHAGRLLMPGPADDHARKEFLARWRAAASKLRRGARDDEALVLAAEAPKHGLAVQQLPWVRRLPDEALRAFENVLIAPSAENVSRAGRWLEACRTHGVPVSLWRLRELFWRWREALLSREAAPGEREAAVALGESLGFSDSALPVAEAMK